MERQGHAQLIDETAKDYRWQCQTQAHEVRWQLLLRIDDTIANNDMLIGDGYIERQELGLLDLKLSVKDAVLMLSMIQTKILCSWRS